MFSAAQCPYCGETIDLFVDDGGEASQRYVEDCQVCCKPFEVCVDVDEDGAPAIGVRRLDE